MFLTALDSRAAVKGSRDPLGVQPIWTRFGRHVVGNLTTVSTSVRDFSVLLWGLRLAEYAAEAGHKGADVEFFLRWEQLAGYIRHRIHGVNQGLRGIERIAARVAERGGHVVLSHESAGQILGDQATYGLWGLYTMAARASGLLELERVRLTAAARGFLDAEGEPVLQSSGLSKRELVAIIAQPKAELDLDGNHARLTKGVAALLPRVIRSTEADFYRRHLLHGGPADTTSGRQRRLAELVHPNRQLATSPLQPALVAALADNARASGDAVGAELAKRMDRIAVCESVLAVSSDLFGWCLGAHGATLAQLERDLRVTWGNRLGTIDAKAFAALDGDLLPATQAADTAKLWIAVAAQLSQGDFPFALESLCEINRRVMHARGGGPWVDLRAGKLEVHYREASPRLPNATDLPKIWRFSYFLDPLRQVAADLAAAT